jgi:hypothetical protein
VTEPLRNIHSYGGHLPSADIRPLILADAALMHRLYDEGAKGRPNETHGLDRLATVVGMNVRQLLKYVTGQAEWISLDNADKYLCATGRHLRDVWPWLYTMEQIEADLDAVENADLYRRRKDAERERERRKRIKLEMAS